MPSKPDRDDQIEAETHNLVPDQPGRIDSEAVLITVLQVRVHIESRIKRNAAPSERSEEHTSELQSLMRISYAVFCLKKKNTNEKPKNDITTSTNRTKHDIT